MTVHHALKYSIGRSEPSLLACSSPLPSSCLVSHLRHSHGKGIRLPHTCNLHVRLETNRRRVGHSAVRKPMIGDVFFSHRPTIDALVSLSASPLIHPTQRPENGCKCISLKRQRPRNAHTVVWPLLSLSPFLSLVCSTASTNGATGQ